ncbi:class I SAM-dependent methyltransferase [Trinickia dinghuensis]|uniref:Class I SAM-dependent methyltransferase n=1 Tax=Trinickia dinghuensis TaxID=2291023 RepID=A0A3D8K6P7_9BURK|nr:class I SAM-dependent methyltransferase [Trinickia dinghuensis]RDV00555.1 class I SAM-dependent methyltransferase [Trinickia dinghuensis]
MNAMSRLDDEQAKRWNGPAGQAWVDLQGVLDRLFEPFEDLLVEAVSASRGERVLDVGCGTGSTTLAVARQPNAPRRCVGIDVSEPMIAAARARAEREGSSATFIHGNAQNHVLERAGFDVVISRFGVMFFADAVAAFSNLRHATTSDGWLHVIAWRSAAENPFMTTAERAAAPLLPNLPARRSDSPGQFAFADPARVNAVLAESGWSEIDLRPIDVPCVMAKKDLIPYLSRLGPVGAALQGTKDPTRENIVETVAAAFEPYVHGAEVRFTAACWMVRARA